MCELSDETKKGGKWRMRKFKSNRKVFCMLGWRPEQARQQESTVKKKSFRDFFSFYVWIKAHVILLLWEGFFLLFCVWWFHLFFASSSIFLSRRHSALLRLIISDSLDRRPFTQKREKVKKRRKYIFAGWHIFLNTYECSIQLISLRMWNFIS